MLKELKDTVVHCKTKEEYEKLIDLYVDNGWVWMSGEPRGRGGFDEWTRDGSKMYVECNNLWCRYGLEYPFKIISLSDFLSLQGLTADGTTEELKEGDWVEFYEDCSRNSPAKFFRGERFRVVSVDGRRIEIDASSKRKEYQSEQEGFHSWANYAFYKGMSGDSFRKIPAPVEKKAFCPAKPEILKMWIDEGAASFDTDHSIPTQLISIPKPRMSFVDYFNNSVLSSEERALRKHGIKNNSGLTCEGEKFVLAFLADKFKPELVKKVKELAKERKAEDDED